MIEKITEEINLKKKLTNKTMKLGLKIRSGNLRLKHPKIYNQTLF